MPSRPMIDLAGLFQQAEAALEAERASLNQLDESNHNHGDHMVAIFRCASQAAAQGGDLPQAMAQAAVELRHLPQNGTAQVYAHGLECLASQLQERQIGLDDLLAAVRSYLSASAQTAAQEAAPMEAASDTATGKQGEVMKALLHALSTWEQVEAAAGSESTPAGAIQNGAQDRRGMDLGYLFGVGMAYLQAKQQGGDKLDVLTETVVSASPLGGVPHRHASGVLAVRSLLTAMRSG